jgi:hypothetical protein
MTVLSCLVKEGIRRSLAKETVGHAIARDRSMMMAMMCMEDEPNAAVVLTVQLMRFVYTTLGPRYFFLRSTEYSVLRKKSVARYYLSPLVVQDCIQ